MPRWACRITLEITNIRVERLQDISEEDAHLEGCKNDVEILDDGSDYKGLYAYERFQNLWESINPKKHPWKSNPWVWVLEFKTI